MPEQRDDGGYVYPFAMDSEHYLFEESGITRRDWLAGLAMQGIMARDKEIQMDGKVVAGESHVADLAYRLADAMIAEGKNSG